MNSYKIKIQSTALYLVVRLLGFTYRFRFLNWDEFESSKQKVWKEEGLNPNYLFCLWHQNLMAGILSQAKTPHCILVSPSRDGEFLVQVCQKLGYKTARGSSSRQGVKGMVEMIRALRQGMPGAVTVDGPKGPSHEVKLGAIEMAKKTQTPIFGYSAYPKKFWSLRSWDRFRIPKPFTEIAIYLSPPLFHSENNPQTTDSLALQLKEQLLAGEIKCINSFQKSI